MTQNTVTELHIYELTKVLLFLVCIYLHWNNPWMGPIGKF